MPKVNVMDVSGKKVSELELSEAVFGIEPNKQVMHAAVVNYLANQRQGTQSTRTRAEVRGGGRKPWRQKGTGHARQGSIRSPQWTHGGIALGPKPRDYSYSLNKKVKRLALKSALSSKVQDGSLVVVDSMTMEEYKTKKMVEILNNLSIDGKALLVLPQPDSKVVGSVSNIKDVKAALADSINTYDILNAKYFVTTVAGIEKIQEVFA